MTEQLFTGLRVVDAGSFIAAPAAATLFGDFGADVIKLEPPAGGDPWRAQFGRPGTPATTTNYMWALASRNKRSLAVDLKTPGGQTVLSALVRSADVFITNLPFVVRDRLGIAYPTLAALNPRLVYASFSSFGEAGDERDRPGFDGTVWWTRSGLAYQLRNGPDAEPHRPLSGMGDHMSGVALFGAACAALYRRERTGRGGEVGTSLLATGAWSNASALQAALCGAAVGPPLPRREMPNPLQNYYRCADGRWVFLNTTYSPAGTEWAQVCAALGLGEAATQPEFATAEARRTNKLALIDLLEAHLASRDAATWHERLKAFRITSEILVSVEEAASDPQMRAAGAIVPSEGEAAEAVSSPLWMTGSPKRVAGSAPKLGQHSTEILESLDFSADEIDRLRDSGAIAIGP